jgi:hypothetical protein
MEERRAEVVAAVRRSRPQLARAADPRALERFLDRREGSSSVHVDEPFQVATLARARDRSSLDRRSRGAVMFLHPPVAGGLFGDAQVRRDYDLVGSRHAEVVADFEALGERRAGFEYVVEEGAFHPYKGVARPVPSLAARPASLDVGEDRLLKPSERRANQDFLRKAELAKQLLKAVEADRARALKQLQVNYKNGVLGVDHCDNKDSRVYAETALQNERLRARTAEANQRRSEALCRTADSVGRHGYDFLRHDAPPVAADHQFSGKARVATAPQHDTHARLFERKVFCSLGVRRPMSVPRAFDIVTGAKTTVQQPAPAVQQP